MKHMALMAALTLIVLCGCKKKPTDVPTDSAPPAPAKGSSASSGSGSGVQAPAGGGGTSGIAGGGALFGTLKAARRTQSLNELKNLGDIIEELRDPFGKMPSKDQILADLKKSAPNILKAIEEGSYILTGTGDGSGLWAYEVDADKVPGNALIGGRAQRTTPEEVSKYLASR